MFSPRLHPLKGHEMSYGSCNMNRIYFVQSSTDECKYLLLPWFTSEFNQLRETLFVVKDFLKNYIPYWDMNGLWQTGIRYERHYIERCFYTMCRVTPGYTQLSSIYILLYCVRFRTFKWNIYCNVEWTKYNTSKYVILIFPYE